MGRTHLGCPAVTGRAFVGPDPWTARRERPGFLTSRHFSAQSLDRLVKPSRVGCPPSGRSHRAQETGPLVDDAPNESSGRNNVLAHDSTMTRKALNQLELQLVIAITTRHSQNERPLHERHFADERRPVAPLQGLTQNRQNLYREVAPPFTRKHLFADPQYDPTRDSASLGERKLSPEV